MFNPSEVIVLTNKQTPMKTSASLCSATTVANDMYRSSTDTISVSFRKLLIFQQNHVVVEPWENALAAASIISFSPFLFMAYAYYLLTAK